MVSYLYVVSKRRCLICRRTFQPHPRVGDRQKVCSNKSCQRERHKKACKAFRKRNSDYDKANRLRTKLTQEVASEQVSTTNDPLRQIAWDAARDVVGLEVTVLTEEIAKNLVQYTRDVVHDQRTKIIREFGKNLDQRPRDEIGENRSIA